jgi:uncharacterized protein YjiS (DUF1127 family)
MMERLARKDLSQMSDDELACIILGRHDAKAAELSDKQPQAIVDGGSDEPRTS